MPARSAGRRRPGFEAVVPVLAVLAATGLAGCATSTLAPQATPVVERIGDGVERYGGSDLWVVVEYQFADMSLGEEWLMLDVAATAAEGRTATIERDRVFVRTPGGARVPLASQRQFSQAYRDLRSRLVRADIVSNPVLYFPPTRALCGFHFFAAPGTGITFDDVVLNDRRACTERFFFNIPGGVQAGRWVLGMDLVESDVRIPFELGGR
jgi:hypothetical protein